MSDPPATTADHDARLDRALAALPDPELDPLWARSTRLSAERRLRTEPALSPAARYEPFLLIALSALQLLWAALRVLALLPR